MGHMPESPVKLPPKKRGRPALTLALTPPNPSGKPRGRPPLGATWDVVKKAYVGGTPKKVSTGKPRGRPKGSGKSTPTQASASPKKATSSGKPRGRPPGSKNKKALKVV